MHAPGTQKKAVELRRKGYSYAMIAEQLKVPKGTLHWWLRDIPYSPNQYARLRRKEGFAHSASSRALQAHERGRHAREKARAMVGTITRKDILLAGIGLLLNAPKSSSRGAMLRTANERVARFATKWFRETLAVAPEHFAPFIQIAKNRNYAEAVRYWADTTGIPAEQFGAVRLTPTKVQSGKPAGRDHGTLYLAFRGCGKRHFKVDLEQRIQSFRDSLLEKDSGE